MTVVAERLQVEFQVFGLPIAQGSKTPWGTESAKGLKSWRQDMAVTAREAMGDRPPTRGAVVLSARFVFPRPRSHYGTGRNAGKLKKNAPSSVAKKPDLDKLLRSLGDALTGVILHDDSQIVTCDAAKIFGEHPGVHVWIAER